MKKISNKVAVMPPIDPKGDQVEQTRELLYQTMNGVDAAIDQVARRSTPMTPQK